jgi:hypothetical protein
MIIIWILHQFDINQRVNTRTTNTKSVKCFHRIQHKYYGLIRSKLLERILIINTRVHNLSPRNTITKTFFNFTYKKYRFHFGIYVPCHTSYNLYESVKTYNTPIYPKGQGPDNNTSPSNIPFTNVIPSCLQGLCKIPSPFVMSQGRHACILHQKQFFRDQLLSKSDPTTIEKQKHHNKITRANKLFHDWGARKSKRIYSLGIQYTVKYHANGQAHVLTKGNRYMYKKKLTNFKITPSKNPRTRKKQKKTFY